MLKGVIKIKMRASREEHSNEKRYKKRLNKRPDLLERVAFLGWSTFCCLMIPLPLEDQAQCCRGKVFTARLCLWKSGDVLYKVKPNRTAIHK